MCYYNETDFAYCTFYLTQIFYLTQDTDTGPASLSNDHIKPSVSQRNYHNTQFYAEVVVIGSATTATGRAS